MNGVSAPLAFESHVNKALANKAKDENWKVHREFTFQSNSMEERIDGAGRTLILFTLSSPRNPTSAELGAIRSAFDDMGVTSAIFQEKTVTLNDVWRFGYIAETSAIVALMTLDQSRIYQGPHSEREDFTSSDPFGRNVIEKPSKPANADLSKRPDLPPWLEALWVVSLVFCLCAVVFMFIDLHVETSIMKTMSHYFEILVFGGVKIIIWLVNIIIEVTRCFFGDGVAEMFKFFLTVIYKVTMVFISAIGSFVLGVVNKIKF